MKWTTAVSQHPQATLAFREACEQLETSQDAPIDVLLVFFSEHHIANAHDLALTMARDFPNATAVGCDAAGVVGSANIGGAPQPSLSVMAGYLPGVEVQPLRLEAGRHDQPDFDWQNELAHDSSDPPHFLILSQADSFQTDGLLDALGGEFSDSQIFGGLIDTETTEQNCLILEGHVYNRGAVGLVLSGNLRVDTVVAQASRPIGEPMIVTQHTENIIHQFNRGNPMEVFRAMVAGLDEEDRKLARHAMFVGIGIETKSGVYDPGDFVIRNLIGFNPKVGDLAVAAPIQDLDVIQFHLMDPQSTTAQFEQAMRDFSARLEPEETPAGALLFSGLSAAEDRSDKALEESDILRAYFDKMPLGGYFSEGEIGPVGRQTSVHGYASTVVFFRSRS